MGCSSYAHEGVHVGETISVSATAISKHLLSSLQTLQVDETLSALCFR